jgi:hypothetical protein
MRRKPIKLNNEVKMRQTWPFLLFTSIYFIITLISTTIASFFFKKKNLNKSPKVETYILFKKNKAAYNI